MTKEVHPAQLRKLAQPPERDPNILPTIKKLKKVKGWPDPHGLTHAELIKLVLRLQGILWGDDGKPDDSKERECDTIENVSEALSDYGLRP